MNEFFSKRLRRDEEAEAGFTLVELLVVIAILGILAGVAVFSVRGIISRGETSACASEVSTVRTAEESAFAQDSTYYTSDELLAKNFINSAPTYLTATGSGTTYSLAPTAAATSAGCTIPAT